MLIIIIKPSVFQHLAKLKVGSFSHSIRLQQDIIVYTIRAFQQVYPS
jgi:hypothetical protein